LLCLVLYLSPESVLLRVCTCVSQAVKQNSAPAGSSKQQQVLLDSKTVLERVFVRTLSRIVEKQQCMQILDLEIDCSKQYKVHG
jgi:hypothetical protein